MLKKNNNKLGELIKGKREKLGISQRELARQVNMDCAEVSRIEAGKRQKPNILYLKGISELLNISLVELMKLACYSDHEINWGNDLDEKRSSTDYKNQIDSYEKFYFDVLEDISNRRKSARECKGIFADIIDRIDNPDCYSSKITLEEISEKLKDASRALTPNIEKFDKDKLPDFDRGVHKGIKMKSTYKINTLTGDINEEK